jgi:hypothetical protein
LQCVITIEMTQSPMLKALTDEGIQVLRTNIR